MLGFHVIFRLAALAIEILVHRSPAAMAQVGDDEARIGALRPALDARDDAAHPAPGAGAVVELLEAPHLAAARGGGEAGGGARFQAGDVSPQRAGGRQAENVIDPLGLAPVEHLGTGIMPIGAHQDLDPRPVRSDRTGRGSRSWCAPMGIMPVPRCSIGARPSVSITFSACRPPARCGDTSPAWKRAPPLASPPPRAAARCGA